MTDNTPWQPPAAPSPPSQPAAPFTPPYGAVPPAPGAPGWSPPPPSGAPGWTPPPKPGLIPLRPLTLGTILGAAFQVLRRNPKPMFGFALLLTGFVFVLTLVVVGFVTFFAVSRASTATSADAETIAAGTFATIVLSAFVPAVLSIVITAVLQGIVVLEVARGTLGEKLRLGGLWRAAQGRIGALVGWALLMTAAVLVAVALVGLVIGLLIALGGTAGVAIGVILGVLAVAGAIVLAFWLGTRLCLVPSVIVLERLPIRQAIARSWSLTIGYFWKTLGIQLLVSFIVQTVATIITTPLQILMAMGGFLINPNQDQGGLLAGGVVLYLLTIIVTIVFGAIAAVVQSATTALIYIDIRMRKEGLDLELSRFVEARQAGDTTVRDPYLPGESSAAPFAAPSTSPWS